MSLVASRAVDLAVGADDGVPVEADDGEGDQGGVQHG